MQYVQVNKHSKHAEHGHSIHVTGCSISIEM